MRVATVFRNSDQFRLISYFFLVSALFFVPVSSSGKSIAIGVALGFIVLNPNFRTKLVSLSKKHWFQATILLFTYALIACFWGPATLHEKLLVISKYTKWLTLPVLVIGFSNKTVRHLSMHAFLFAMVITCVVSLCNFFYFNSPDPGAVFRNHIMTGFMMSFAAYLSTLFAYRASGVQRLCYGLLVTLFSFQVLFVNTGRTGYVIYVMMLGLLAVQYLSWRKMLLALCVGGCCLGLVFLSSTTLRTGVNGLVSEYEHYQKDNKDTSLGYRLQFHAFAKQLFNRNPILGNGTASFTASYRIEQPVDSWSRRLLEPHSNYWLILSEYGLVGGGIFLFLFVSLLLESLKMSTMRPVALALILPFIIGNLSDSLLFYSGTGYFFILVMALCLGEREDTKANASK